MYSAPLSNVVRYLKTLMPEQLQELLAVISALMNGTEPECSQPFKPTTCCPHCTSKAFVKDGLRKGRQRYKCKTCQRKFGDTNGTPLYRSKLSVDTVNTLIEQTLMHRSIAQTAVDSGLNTKTVWLFRQKLMTAIKKRNGSQDFFGSGSIVESDEFYLPLSFKGKRDLGFFLNVLRRMPRHHYSRADKLAYLKRKGFYWRDYIDILDTTRMRQKGWNQIAIMTAVDRSGKTFIEPLTLGMPTTYQVQESLQGHHAKDIVLVTDEAKNYKYYAKRCGLTIEQVHSKSHARGAFHIAHVNSYHSRLNSFFPPEKRCASKYLDGYCALFRYVDKTRSWVTSDRVAPLSELAYSAAGGYYPTGKLTEKELPFDDKGIMAMQRKGATLIGKSLQVADKVRSWIMAFFM